MKKNTVVVYDFDGTITRKDTLLEFIKFSKGHFLFYFGFLLFSPLLIAMKLRLYPNWKIKQSLFSFYYKGTPIQQFEKWGKEFSIEIDKMIRIKAKESIQKHLKQNNTLVIASASIENWIKPWADQMGFDDVLATKIETDINGKLTGKFISKNCYGQEKVNRLLEVFPDRQKYKLIAYGDSKGDLELIKFADQGFHNKFN